MNQAKTAFKFKKSWKVYLALTLSTMAVNSAVFAADELSDVVQEALLKNPEVTAKAEAFYVSNEEVRVAEGGYYPSVDLNSSVGRVYRDFDNRGRYTRTYAELALTQMLFDGFRVRNRLSRYEHAARESYYELYDEAQNKALEVSSTYFDVMRYRELVQLAQQNVANHMQVGARIEERARSGVSNQADLQQIEGRVSLARNNLMTEVANLQSVTARFQRLVGRAPGEQLTPVDFASSATPASLEETLKLGYANNPALYAKLENIGSAKASLGEAKANRYPEVDLRLSHGLYRNDNSFDERFDRSRYGDENVIELRAKYNLYNGGSDMAAERAAHRRINQAEALRDKACVDIRQTATIAYTDTLNLTLKRPSLITHRDASKNVVEAYKDQFNIGRRSLLDVLDSENEAYQAERAYVAGHYDLIKAKLQTLNSTGTLLNTLIPQQQGLPTLAESLEENKVLADTTAYCSAMTDAQLNIDSYLSEIRVPQTLSLSGDTLFATGSANLTSAAYDQINTLWDQVERGDGNVLSVLVVGHTDSTGTKEKNRALSLQRAEAVRDALIQRGLAAELFVVVGVAEAEPVASNSTEEGRQQNRRVEIQVQRN